MDLGAGTFRTFWSITLPMLRSALLAGCAAVLRAVSFDEIIVTTFTAGQGIQTLPIWIYQNLFRPNQAPVVNVVAAALIVLSIVPIWLAPRSSPDRRVRRRRALSTRTPSRVTPRAHAAPVRAHVAWPSRGPTGR